MRFPGIFDPLRLLVICVAASVAMLIGTINFANAEETWAAECKLKLQASLPFTLENGHILVAVHVNDVPHIFAIDTGGFLSSISEKAALSQGLKLRQIRDDLAITGVGGKRAQHYVNADTLTIAHLRAEDVRLVIQPNYSGGSVDGIIAPDYLRNFDIEFDFAASRLNLFQPHRCPDHAVYWTDHFTTLPLDVTPQGHIRVRATLDDKDLEALIDTGSPATLIGARTVAAKFDLNASSDGLTLNGSTGGQAFADVHRFHSLQLGDIAIKNPALLVSSDESAWRSDDANLLLGLRELSKFHIYLAYRARTIYFSPIESYSGNAP